MSNYTKLTDFASKDALPSGNANKIVKGTEIDDEFEAIETAIGTKADLASPTFTGTPAAPTATTATNSTQVATTAFVQAQKASMALTGNPTAPTQATGNDSTRIATTAFVQQEITANAYTLPYASQTTKGGARIYVSGGDLYIYTQD